MANEINGTSNTPFNVGLQIQEQTQRREAIQNTLKKQRLEGEHRAKHRHLEDLANMASEARKSSQAYNRGGQLLPEKLPEGLLINKEI